MNFFSFFLSGKLFIWPSILNDSFVVQSNLGCRFLLFITLNISCHSLLACKVSFEKLADSLMGEFLTVLQMFPFFPPFVPLHPTQAPLQALMCVYVFWLISHSPPYPPRSVILFQASIPVDLFCSSVYYVH
uniref:Uncharacterized protein n=1 Tax=Molossus molossus TaxID=27622 RepID=A0A7J8DTP2_MOLMO|nr:hypothetical protein HJG59_009114 [Molossus molossus]